MPAHEVPTHHASHKRGGASADVADIVRRLAAMEIAKARGHLRSHDAQGGYVIGGEGGEGGAHIGGARHRKTDRPLSAYQMFMSEHLHAARMRAEQQGLRGQDASREAFREVVAMWHSRGH